MVKRSSSKVAPKKPTKKTRRSSRRVKPGWIAIALIVGAVAAYAVVVKGTSRVRSLVYQLGLTSVKEVTVKGAEQVPGDQIVAAAGIMAGVSIDRAKLDSLRNAFLRNPWVGSVDVSHFAGNLMVKIVERKPLVLVSLGKVYQMDRDGVLLPLPAGDYLHAPVVCGLCDTVDHFSVHRVRAAGLETFMTFWDELAKQDPAWRSSLAQVDLSRPNTLRLTLEARSTVIEIGRDQIGAKIGQVTQLLESLRSSNEPVPHTINLGYENLAFVE